MRVLILAAATVMLVGCHKPAQTQAPAASAVAAAPVAHAWSGTYEGDNLRLTLSGTAGARKIVLIAATQTCTGDIGLNGEDISVKDVSETELDAGLPTQGKGWCEVKLDRSGNSITLSETDTCQVFHGMQCSFNGTVTRVK